MNDSVVAAMDTMLLPGADPLRVSVACEAVIAWAHARQLEAIHEVDEQSPEFFDNTGVLVEPAAAEIGCALHWSAGAASRRVDLAATICTDLPELLTALRDGRLDLAKAEEITRGTSELELSDRTTLAESAIEYAGSHTRAQLRAWLARQVAAIDPEAVRRRRKKALRARRVWIQPEPDGMATIGAYLSAEEAQACWNALTAGASNIDGAVDPARADVFVALLTGLTVGEPVPVQVILTGSGPELSGHGAISRSHSAELCKGTDLIDLTRPPKPSTGYRPAPTLARWVRARDRHCRFPGCRRPAVMCDLDHVIPHPSGPTEHTNLAALCRYHHRLKTHTPWSVQMLDGAVLRWTSPRGHVFHTSLDDP
jgi:hypothetical protein